MRFMNLFLFLNTVEPGGAPVWAALLLSCRGHCPSFSTSISSAIHLRTVHKTSLHAPNAIFMYSPRGPQARYVYLLSSRSR